MTGSLRFSVYIFIGQAPTTHEINLDTITSVNGDSLPEVPEETTELDVHYVSLYDKFLQYKEACCAYTRERVMRFMRHELENEAQSGEGCDVEGGSAGTSGPRASNATYDSLIFKVTLLVGFLLRFPLMWVMGSILFLCSNNFKKTTIRWGCINIFFAIASIGYACQRWRKLDLFTIDHPHPSSTIFVNMINNVEMATGGHDGTTGTLVVNGKACNYFDIDSNTALEWLEHRSDGKEEDLNLSGKSFKAAGALGSRGFVYDAGRMSGKMDYALVKNYKLLVGGKFQIAASMSVDPTEEHADDKEAVVEGESTLEEVAEVLKVADEPKAPPEPEGYVWISGAPVAVKGEAPQDQKSPAAVETAAAAASGAPVKSAPTRTMYKIKNKTLPRLGNLATSKPAKFDLGLVCKAEGIKDVYWATLKAKNKGTVAKVFKLPNHDTYTCHFVCANHHSLAVKHVYIKRV